MCMIQQILGDDQVQIFVDKKGDSKNKLDKNDVFYTIDTSTALEHKNILLIVVGSKKSNKPQTLECY